MSKHWLRHVIGALICGLVPLIPMSSVSASSPIHAASPTLAAAAVPESAVLQKFRDSGPPTMEAAAQFEATAPIHNYAPAKPANTQLIHGVTNPRLFREVFGFAFASSLGDPTIGYPSWNFGLLSTVAYFGVHVDWTGDFSSDSGLAIWNDPNGPVPGFIQTAHANGTKVVLTIEMFDSTNGTPNMCSALQRGALTIQRTVAQVNARAIDGVNIDYESNNSTCTDPSTGAVQSSQSLFTTFVQGMRAALPSGSYLTLDSYSGSAGYRDASGAYLGFFDIGALANSVDAFFVMAYDMEYANWDASPLNCPTFCIGPTAPLSTYLFNDGRASSEYRAVVPASKVIMGIPYYGRKECVGGYTPSTAPPNAVGSTTPVADGYLDASTENGYIYNSDYQIHRETRDPLSQTRWDTFTSSTAGCTRELYWDDAVALGNKYNLVINDGLRGAGIFALNYGGGAPELWNEINLKFGQCSEAAIAADKTTPQIPGTSITFTGSALCAGTAQYEFYVQPPGGAWALIQPYSASNTFTWNTTGKALGTYSVQVAAKNLGAVASYDTVATMSFRLALCTTPALTADHASPQLPGTPVTFTAAGTCQGTPEYRYWKTPPGGVKTMVEDYSSTATFAWTTAGVAYGAYSFAVDVRVAGTTVAAEASQIMAFSLTSCIAPALTTDKTSPQPTGTQVGLSGSATCVGVPQYRFMIQPPGGTFGVVQDFSTISTFTWIGSGAGGTYGLELDAKGAGLATSTMDSTEITFVLASCTSVTLATSAASPQIPGTTVVLTATATCPGTTQYRFSISNPAGASSIVQDFGSANTYSWNTTGLALGNYGLKVDVRNVGAIAAFEASASVVYTLAHPACTTPTLTSDLASPRGAGTVVTFSATTTTCPLPLYKFWVQSPNATWTVMQDYSTSNTWKWHVTGPGGNYRIEVDVRDSTRPVTYDQFAVLPYVINVCTGATLSPSVPSPQASGTQVVLTGAAGASFCPNPLYQFWTLAPGSSTWIVAQAYSATATFTWNSTGRPPGIYHLSVWVRDASGTGAVITSLGNFDTFAGATYTLTTQPCTSVTASAAPPSPSAAGTAVALTGVASGCPNPLYQFWILVPGSSTWTIAQAYSSSATFNWTTTGLVSSTYRFSAWVRDTSSTGTSCNSLGCDDAYAAINYTLARQSCTSATASASPISPSTVGTAVTFTGIASGCPNPLYQFWILPPGSSTWTTAEAYSTSATFNWTTTGKAPGTYHFSVWVRDSSSVGAISTSLGTFDAFVGMAYTLTSLACTSVTASAAPASSSPSGTAVTLTGVAVGCPNPLYQFWILAPGSSTWTIALAYSTSATFNWTTTAKAAGMYRFSVWVRDSSSAGAITTSLGNFDAYVAINYTLTSTPCNSVTASAAPISPSASGTTVTVTGVAAGCPSPLYEFWMLAPRSTTWTMVQAYSTSASFNWTTSGLPAGVYRFSVWVRDSSSVGVVNTSLGNFDAFVGISFTLT